MNQTVNSDLPLVSIVVITYNSSKYVIETLESAKAQTYLNIELIISDDCSTDSTCEICKTWVYENSSRFARTKVIEAHHNTGIPSNLNRGLSNAQGQWIKFIAGDDVLLANCVDVMIAFAIANSSWIVTSAVDEFCEDDLPLRIRKGDHLTLIRFFEKKEDGQFRSYLRNPIFLNSPALFFRSELFRRIGHFDERFRMLEDQPYILKALREGYHVDYSEAITVRYRTVSKELDRVAGQQDDFYLCYSVYRRPYLSRFRIGDWMVLYDLFLSNRYRRASHAGLRIFYRLLFNMTDIVYIQHKRQR